MLAEQRKELLSQLHTANVASIPCMWHVFFVQPSSAWHLSNNYQFTEYSMYYYTCTYIQVWGFTSC